MGEESVEERVKGLVWIIDDEKIARRLFSDALSKYGECETRIFEDAQSALKALKDGEKSPDAVICDLRMPGMTGDEFYRNAGEYLNRALKCLATAYWPPTKNENPVLPEDVQVLQKPVSVSNLVALVSYHVSSKYQPKKEKPVGSED